MPKRTDDEVSKLDKEIGARLRHARKSRGKTQTQLGDVIGVSFQQLQKYERGTNRVSSSTLVLLAKALEISPIDLLGSEGAKSPALDWNLMAAPGASELLTAYAGIDSIALRRLVLELSRRLTAPAEA